jgi:hypothetical protein
VTAPADAPVPNYVEKAHEFVREHLADTPECEVVHGDCQPASNPRSCSLFALTLAALTAAHRAGMAEAARLVCTPCANGLARDENDRHRVSWYSEQGKTWCSDLRPCKAKAIWRRRLTGAAKEGEKA